MPSKEEKVLKWSEMCYLEKARYLVRNITVEPMLACYIVPCVLAQIATQNLNLEKACRVNLHYSDEVCHALETRNTKNYTREETEVQQLVASMSIWRSMLQSSIPAVLIMFLGSWSDRARRRKPFMLMPIIGEFMSTVSLILCVYYFYQLPMEVAGFVDSFFPAITGGWMTMFMAIFSYMADITTVEMRTLRIGIVNMFCTVGVPLGTALSGILYKAVGFYGVFSISASFYVFSFSYGLIRIKEASEMESPNTKVKSETKFDSDISKANSLDGKQCAIFSFLRDFFDVSHIKETFSVVLKDGPHNRKRRVVLLMIVLMVVIGPVHGEMTVMYLFTRYKFNWDEVQFSLFSTYTVVIHMIGTALSVGVFSHLLKMDDALIGVMSSMSKILAGFVYAFAQTEWQIYIAPLVDIMNGTSFIAMRSIASKLVPPEELGKLNSLYGACEALTPLIYGPMYAFVYAQTIDTLPGAFMLLGGALTSPAVIIFGWMYSVHRREKQQNSQHQSRKSSLAEDIFKTLKVDPMTVPSSILALPTDSEHQNKRPAQGQENAAFEDLQ